jgi:hypothetical protein
MDRQPENLIPLIDGDILRYEIGFAAETGWRAITEERENIPPFHYVEKLLLSRLAYMRECIGTEEVGKIYLTEGPTFRYDLAKTKPYKGTRKDKKPWHYDNLTVYMRDVLGAEIVTEIEADDAIAIEHCRSKVVIDGGVLCPREDGTCCGDPSNCPEEVREPETIICSRDKDLRQLPGWFYSWELGKQASFGPVLISHEGTLEISEDKKKLIATGLAAFYGQVLTGDRVDNIPGLDKCGPVAAYNMLKDNIGDNRPFPEMLLAVQDAYDDDELLLEQGQLCWLVRRLNPDGSPQLWEIGLEE